MGKLGLVVLCQLVLISPAQSAEKTATRVEAINGDVKCFQSKIGWITNTTGPCSNFIPPRTIAIGETFEVDGKSIVINYISVVADDGNPSDIACAAAADKTQIPLDDRETNRIWVYVQSCVPVK